ncbi:NAD(P)-binding domain-containing protein [Patescibacteria group bacterium]|nr:NAD(P)-binding domain-containing protein [Patescibacteria group bacterium]MBU1951825.1 NAD(P)-binding domain-containing protein [Patescibacteria group bacterium]
MLNLEMYRKDKKTNISIYGLGNFGYALLKHFDKKLGINIVSGYDRNKTLLAHLMKERSHLSLYKEHRVSKNVIFAKNTKELLADCDILVLASPSHATREVIKKVKPYLTEGISIVNTAKALDYQTGKRLSEIIKKELNSKDYKYALFAGGTIASDLFKQEPLGATLACEDKEVLSKLVKIFESPNLHVYPSSDLSGVEYASAFKNVVSILAGIIKGMGFSFGSETHIITVIADEIENIVTSRLGGNKETFSMISQAWGNDLWMSCMGPTRNREFGVLLGKGFSVSDSLSNMKKQRKVVEGVNTIAILNKVVPLNDYPLLKYLYSLIIEKNIKAEAIKKIIFK